MYRLSELAAMAELSPRQLKRMLQSQGIRLQRRGRILVVPLSEIEEKMAWLRKSMQVRDTHEQIAAVYGQNETRA